MRAVVADAGADLVRSAEVPAPVPAAGEVLVDVTTISVNRGELHRLRDAEPGWRPGWDFAGVVADCPHGVADFRVGQRVFGIAAGGGAWAEQVAVPAGQLAPLPAEVDDEAAAAMPVAGLTALRVLRLGGDLKGQRVLVTGAAGGVGRFAVQLADTAGAEVTAVVADAGRAEGLTELGADHVITDIGELESQTAGTECFDVILESVGGATLERALELVAIGGLVVTFGNSARVPAMLPVTRFYPKQAILRGYYLLDDVLTHPAADDLAALAGRSASGRLRVDIDMVRDLEALPEVLHALAERRVAGKAVLRMR